MSDVFVRRATEDDVESLTRLRMAYLAEVGEAGDASNAQRCEQANRAYFASKIPSATFLAWLADAGGDVVATSGLVFLEPPPYANNPAGLEAYVMNMYTVPAWRGKGLGQLVLSAMLDHIRSTPARRIWLQASPLGRPLYEKAGFVPLTGDMHLVL